MGNVWSRLSAVSVACALMLATATLALGAAPAHAGWTTVSSLVSHKICREDNPSGQGWLFLTKVRKRPQTDDARAGAAIHVAGERHQRWSSGWLRGHELDRGWIRTHHTRRVTLHVWQEAGDRDSMIGTALEQRVLRPRQVKRCG